MAPTLVEGGYPDIYQGRDRARAAPELRDAALAPLTIKVDGRRISNFTPWEGCIARCEIRFHSPVVSGSAWSHLRAAPSL